MPPLSFSLSLFLSEPLSPDLPPLVHQAVKERWQIYALRSGMETLPRALLRALQGKEKVEVAIGTPCTGVSFGHKSVKVSASNASSSQLVAFSLLASL